MAAYALETGGKAEVTAVLRSNYDMVSKSGFSIDSIEHGQGIKGFRPSSIIDRVPNVTVEDLPPYDYILVTTKNIPDVRPTVLELIKPAVTPGSTTIVLLQNGLNIEKQIIDRFPDNVVLSGVSTISASEPTYGHIIHEFPDVAKLGPFPGQKVSSGVAEKEARRLIDMYNASGKVEWVYDDDVAFTRWRKLVYNASFNPVSAILKMGVIRMRMTRHIIDDLIRPAMLEIIGIAKADGVELPPGIDDFFIRLDPAEAEDDFVPSMGQDAIKGNYMEIETIVGEPVREAQRLGVPVPTLQVIYGLLKGQQVKTKESKGLWQAEFAEDNPYR